MQNTQEETGGVGAAMDSNLKRPCHCNCQRATAKDGRISAAFLLPAPPPFLGYGQPEPARGKTRMVAPGGRPPTVLLHTLSEIIINRVFAPFLFQDYYAGEEK
jgi:hypothetical protein